MLQDRLNDAAIALQQVLEPANVTFGIFGGYAVVTLGGIRESKDIDCIAKASKAQVVALLDKKNGFTVIPQTRSDYVGFLWSAPGDSRNSVLVEIFPEQFPGAKFTMDNLRTTPVQLKGLNLGTGQSTFVEPFRIFMGKLCAAATRDKFHDSVDLRTLLSRHGNQIKPRVAELNLKYVGLAIKRYLMLEKMFLDLGVDVERAKKLAGELNSDEAYPHGQGQVQYALLG